ncbi:MAG: DUF433 domain-containing protein [Thermoguttaceae bacterium]|jgi:uncharacterized protein (DUF433 family)
MSLLIEAERVPLEQGEDGVIRVGGTRVTLDTIVTAYQQGEPPETIADQYPSVSLPDVFAVIGFYLRHRNEVEGYLAQERQRADAVRRKHDARFPQEGLRDRLLARRAPKSDS